MKELLADIYDWTVTHKYFFGVGVIVLTVVFWIAVFQGASLPVITILAVSQLIFILIVWMLTEDGHYGDQDCS